MALGDNTLASARGASQRGRNTYMVQTELDFATALSDKGAALLALDVIPVIAVPAGTVIMCAGAEVITAADSTTATVDIATGAGDLMADGFNAKSAVGTYSTPDGDFAPIVVGAADNIDVKLATMTGTLTAGKLRIWAMLSDVSDFGDMTANEVDRDTLA
jgi:hypothetical protein